MVTMAKPKTLKDWESRLTEDYIIQQVETFRQSDSYQNHKSSIEKLDRLYRGELTSLFPNDDTLPEEPLVDNTFKRAIHDISRLAGEARGMPVFYLQGDSETEKKKAFIRNSIAQTEWEEGGGAGMERKLYMDILGGAFQAICVYYDEDSEYPRYLRLDPRMSYPETLNGRLVNMFYIERMYTRKAARVFPNLPLEKFPEKIDEQVLVVSYYDDYESTQVVMPMKRGKAFGVYVQSTWIHELGCVPVAYEELDTFNGEWRSIFDQLGGPIMVRNKAVRLLSDYLEDMAHAPMEFRGILNKQDDPGPLTKYIHDMSEDVTFARRVQPAAPAGAVFGLVQYLDQQESQIAIQPPSRVGQVSQSIASGSFVASTQGGLTSIVRELQDHMATLRVQAQTISMKIEEKWIDTQKGLIRPVEKKNTYTPSKDIDGVYRHRVLYGAAAGLNRMEADVRIQNHLGLGIISKAEARRQTDYLDNQANMDEEIDREDLAKNFKDRLVGDPNQPLSAIAKLLRATSEGKSLIEAVEEVLPDIIAAEEQRAEARATPGAPSAAETGLALPPEQPETGVPSPDQLLDVGLPEPFTSVQVRPPNSL
jgi:hypothetical protein